MDALHFFFHGICHQIDSRALAAGAVTMPLCARCAGTYVAFFLALPVFVLRTRRGAGTPTVGFHFAAGAAFVAYFFDGAANLPIVGFWDTPSALRLATGALAGFVLAPYVATLFAAAYDRPGMRPAAGGRDIAAIVIAAAALAAANAQPPAWLLVAESYASAAGVALFLGLAHASLLTLALANHRRAALALAPITAAGQIAAFSAARSAMGL